MYLRVGNAIQNIVTLQMDDFSTYKIKLVYIYIYSSGCVMFREGFASVSRSRIQEARYHNLNFMDETLRVARRQVLIV